MKITTLKFLICLALHCTTQAHGALQFSELSFATPSASFGASEVLPVELQLTMFPNSAPISIGAGLPNRGIDMSNLPDWDNITDARLDILIGCGHNFSSACVSGGPYDFSFNQSIVGLDHLTLSPGQVWSFSAGTFAPSIIAVPAGTYQLFSVTLALQLTGQQWVLALDVNGLPVFDANGFPVFNLQTTSGYLPLFDTCGFAGDSAFDCPMPFTRTIAASVPEPSAAWMMLVGLVTMTVARRQRMSIEAAFNLIR